MNAIHINWTKPFTNKTNRQYETECFELLTTILSALKWREKNGSIKMITDSIGAEYYRSINIDGIWNSMEVLLDDIDVNPDVFWAAGKLFALSKQTAPTAVIDTDFIVWETLDFNALKDLTVIHFEDLYPDVYPPEEYFDYTFDKRFNWSLNACNTAFYVIKSKKLLDFYTKNAIEFMREVKEKDDRLKYMVFAEQRLLPMSAEAIGATTHAFSSLDRLFSEKDKRFTHTWGMKQQMRDNPALEYSFCRQCIARIDRDYPQITETLRGIKCLQQYFK